MFKQVDRCRARRMTRPARRSTTTGERDHSHAIRERFIQRREMLDALDDIARIVRDLLKAIGVVVTRSHQP